MFLTNHTDDFFAGILVRLLPQKVRLLLSCIVCLVAMGWTAIAEAKVSATIILASVEGEVKAVALDEDFEMTLDESSVGKNLEENFIVTTGKDGKAVFLFSNGVLATLKPNTRLFIREFVQESFSAKDVPAPAELKVEPSVSHLKFHLDFGDMVVKAPKLKKGSSMNLTSPLGTAGIRGTMFQMVVARDPNTGSVSGGVNLISGDIDFSDVSGGTTALASGQGFEISSSNLGESPGSVSGELRDLSAKYGPALAGTGSFPDLVAPALPEELPPEGVAAPEPEPTPLPGLSGGDGWGAIHEIATATFFAIEEAEETVREVTFDQIESAVSVTTPTPPASAPTPPAAVTGGPMAPPDPFFGGYPEVTLEDSSSFFWEMGVPFVDPGGVTVTDFSGVDIGPGKLINPPKVSIPGTYKLIYIGNDFRGLESTATRTVTVKATRPRITLDKPSTDQWPERIQEMVDTEDGTIVYHSVATLFNESLFKHGTPPYSDPGYSAHEQVVDFHGVPGDGGDNLNGLVVVEPNPNVVNTNEPGTYTFTYTVYDNPKRTVEGVDISTRVTRTVHVEDLTPPRIDLGSTEVDFEGGTDVPYHDAGAVAKDNYDEDVSIFAGDPKVNHKVVGTYSVIFQHKDNAENPADTVTRIVNIYDKTPPELTLYGQPFDFIDLNSSYWDPGVLAIDNFDGLIPWEPDPDKRDDERFVVTVTKDDVPVEGGIDGAIDREEVGEFLVTYEVFDNDAVVNPGNPLRTKFSSKISRKVTIRGDNNTPPQISLLPGPGPDADSTELSETLYFEVGSKYLEPGVEASKDIDGKKVYYEVVDDHANPDVLNMNIVGTYSITYSAVDEFGNQALQATRQVNVGDSTPPEIHFAADARNIGIDAGTAYHDVGPVEPHGYIVDNYKDYSAEGAEFTTEYYVKIDGADPVPMNPDDISFLPAEGFLDAGLGTKEYEVIYTTTDDYGNTGTASRTITVTDDTPPNLSLEALSASLPSSVYSFDGGKIIQVVGDNAEVVFDAVSVSPVLEEFDQYGREEVTQGGFAVRDKKTKEIIFQDPGVLVTDNARGELAVIIEITPDPLQDPSASEYTIKYQAKDIAGNPSKYSEAPERTIRVLSGPVITLLGSSHIAFVNQKNTTDSTSTESVDEDSGDYMDAGVSAQDALGNSIAHLVQVSYAADDSPTRVDLGNLSAALDKMKQEIDLVETTGKYEIFYTVTDEKGNSASEVSRTVYSVANDGVSPVVKPRREEATAVEGEEDVWELTLYVDAKGTGNYVEQGATAAKTRHDGLEGPDDPDLPGFSYKEDQNWDESQISVTWEEGNRIPATFGPGDLRGEDNPYVVTYAVADEFGNPGSAKLKIYLLDNTSPTITPNPFPGQDLTPTIEAGDEYEDPGFVATDNYYTEPGDFSAQVYFLKNEEDSNASAVYTIDTYVLGSTITHDAAKVQTWNLKDFGNFYVRYALTDGSGNTKTYTRTVTVEDTTPPVLTLLPDPEGDLDPIRMNQHIPDDSEKSSVYIEYGVTVTDNSRKSSMSLTDEELATVSTGSGDDVVEKFQFQFDETSEEGTVLILEIDTTKVDLTTPGEYTVTYTATDSSGKVGEKTRIVQVLDREKPTILGDSTLFSKDSLPGYPYVVVEGGASFDDDSGQTVKLWNGSDYTTTTPQSLTLSAVDAQDGVMTSRIKRTIYRIDDPDDPFSFSGDEKLGVILDNDVASVSSLIDTSSSSLDKEFLIQYDVEDDADNSADSKYRRIIVKDTLPPVIQQLANVESTITVDHKSTANPDVMNEDSVKDFLLNGVSAVDANNFDQDLGLDATMSAGNLKWVIDINKTADAGGLINGEGYDPGDLYPAIRDDGLGYTVSFTVKDSSGNVSDPLIRYLKVGDYDPPTITMMGKAEIHDFFRFGQSDSANAKQAASIADNVPFLDRPHDKSTNPEIDATGIAEGGAHRMLLSEYKFTDPGAYAEDNNGYWDISQGYPDLDGDGLGEGYATVRVASRADMDACSKGAGIIHAYSWFEKKSYNMKEWNELMASGQYGLSTALLRNDDTGGNDLSAGTSPAKVPDVNDKDGNRGGTPYAFTDSNKTDLTNFDMTTITIEYRVKDGWDNLSEIMTRRVYIYESRQYDGYAFYATPITDSGHAPFEAFYNKDNNATPYLTSMRKDYDGDGVSDYWEAILGTKPNDKSSTPNLANPVTWNPLLGPQSSDYSGTAADWSVNAEQSWLLNQINLLDDARQLKNQSWVNTNHILKDPTGKLTNLP